MLSKEILTANAVLAGLTEEQIEAIVTLSTNDENSVIAKKTGEIYGALDNDILEVSGIGKNGLEKTYEYAKRVLGEMKTQASVATELQNKIGGLEKEKARLEKVIAEGGGDAETAKQLKQARTDLASITQQYNTLNDEHNTLKEKHAQELFDVRLGYSLEAAAAGLKFKEGLPETVTKVIMQQASEKIRGMKPEMIDDGNGGKVIAFKGEDGSILRNPNNQLNPYTPAELLAKELEAMGVLDKGRQMAGAGSQGVTTKRQVTHVVDVTSAKTRTEAYEAIASNLLAQGMTIGSEQFDEAMSQAWKDNNVADLPEK